MTTSFINSVEDAVIPDAAEESNEIILKDTSAAIVTLFGQSDIPSGNTYTFEVRDRADGDWCALHDASGAISVIKAGIARVYAELAGVYSFRIASSAAMSSETATWKVNIHWTS